MQENTGAGYPGDAGVTDDFDLAGVPDAFQRLWTPHRMAYIKGGQHQFKNENDCPFCVGPGRSDEEALIVYRGQDLLRGAESVSRTTPGTSWSAPTGTYPTTRT